MSKISVTNANGETKSLPIDTGLSLMEHLRDAGYEEIQAMCGGCCYCATCHVYIDLAVGEIPPIEENEEALLEMTDGYDAQKSRLSCQIELNDGHNGLKVSLLEDGF